MITGCRQALFQSHGKRNVTKENTVMRKSMSKKNILARRRYRRLKRRGRR